MAPAQTTIPPVCSFCSPRYWNLLTLENRLQTFSEYVKQDFVRNIVLKLTFSFNRQLELVCRLFELQAQTANTFPVYVEQCLFAYIDTNMGLIQLLVCPGEFSTLDASNYEAWLIGVFFSRLFHSGSFILPNILLC